MTPASRTAAPPLVQAWFSSPDAPALCDGKPKRPGHRFYDLDGRQFYRAVSRTADISWRGAMRFHTDNIQRGTVRRFRDSYEVDPQRVAEAMILRLVTDSFASPAGRSGPSRAGDEMRHLPRAA